MIRVEREHRFSTTVEAGFAFITGTANWPRYWPGFVELGPGSQRSVPGDKARIVVRLLGRNVELQMTLGHLVRECSRLFLESGGQGRCHRARLDRDHGDDFIVPSAGIQLMRALPSGAPAGNAGRRVPR